VAWSVHFAIFRGKKTMTADLRHGGGRKVGALT
jgi:hypothetical protein